MSEHEQARKLAERLIDDLDSIEAARHMAVYERDTRLVARDFLAALDREERLLDQVDDAYRSLEAGRKFEAKECLRSIASAALSSPAEPDREQA